MNHRSLAFRLGAWYTLLLSGVFVLVGFGVFLGLQHYLRANVRDTLGRRSAQVEQILLQSPVGSADQTIALEITNRVAPEFNNRFVRVTRLPATMIYRSGMPADGSFDPGAVSASLSNALAAVPTTVRDQHLMIRVTPVMAPSGDYRVELGVSIAPLEAALDRLLELLALLLPVLIVCAAGGGYWLVSRALRPVDQLSQTAEQMSLQNLSLRLPVLPSGDALERLSISFNTMLGRLGESVQTSRRFLADASHELRTPLTVIKGELEELTRESHVTEGDLRERIGSVLEEVARLEHLVSGLLALSRLDAGETQGVWVDVDLAELALNTAEHMQLIAEDRGVVLEVSELQKTVIQGDRARLKQIIVNLLDNAIRFTPQGGTVSLRTSGDDVRGILEIEDTGVGIPSDAIEHVFDRFYRVDEARSRTDGGAGLGLAIVKSICLAHGAEIAVQSRVGSGSRFCVMFPQRSHTASDAPQASNFTGPHKRDPPTDIENVPAAG